MKVGALLVILCVMIWFSDVYYLYTVYPSNVIEYVCKIGLQLNFIFFSLYQYSYIYVEKTYSINFVFLNFIFLMTYPFRNIIRNSSSTIIAKYMVFQKFYHFTIIKFGSKIHLPSKYKVSYS